MWSLFFAPVDFGVYCAFIELFYLAQCAGDHGIQLIV
jgi:hypothetical protein